MSNFWQANGSFDFHIFMNGIYISLGYTVAGFTSVQDSAQHVLRSSSFWETAPLVIIPAAFSLTAQLECTHWLPSHGQITSNHLSPPWLAKWELMPEFDCFSFLYNPRFNNMPPSGGALLHPRMGFSCPRASWATHSCTALSVLAHSP